MPSRWPFTGALSAALLVLVATSAATQPLPGEGKVKRPVVVELYTSQGCSSCPPADALLGHLASRADVLAMSLPVTYWDMLGWRDTLASESNTRRQKAYARQLGRGGIYTPQMVVDGQTDVVGSREPAVNAAIAARTNDMQNVPVGLEGNHLQMHVSVGAAAVPGRHEATIWLFGLTPQATVNIAGGENGGRTITYRNVVRDIRAIGEWKGQPMSLSVPRAEAGAPHQGVAVVLQQGGYGRVLGAALVDRPNFDCLR